MTCLIIKHGNLENLKKNYPSMGFNGMFVHPARHVDDHRDRKKTCLVHSSVGVSAFLSFLISQMSTTVWLVVLTCFNHLEKYEFVNGKDYPIYYGQ